MKQFLSLLAVLTLSATSLFADNGEYAAPPQSSILQTVIMIVIAVAFFYLLLWRPEQKRRKIIEDLRASLKQGDQVVAMGIIGTVLRVQEQTVILKMFDGSKIEVLKGAITDVTSGEAATEEKKD